MSFIFILQELEGPTLLVTLPPSGGSDLLQVILCCAHRRKTRKEGGGVQLFGTQEAGVAGKSLRDQLPGDQIRFPGPPSPAHLLSPLQTSPSRSLVDHHSLASSSPPSNDP